MVVQDDIGIEFQAFMLAAKLEGVKEQVKIGLPGEKGNPFDHRAGDEVGEVRVSDGVAAAHGAGGQGGEAGASPETGVPKLELGNEIKTIFSCLSDYHLA